MKEIQYDSDESLYCSVPCPFKQWVKSKQTWIEGEPMVASSLCRECPYFVEEGFTLDGTKTIICKNPNEIKLDISPFKIREL